MLIVDDIDDYAIHKNFVYIYSVCWEFYLKLGLVLDLWGEGLEGDPPLRL